MTRIRFNRTSALFGAAIAFLATEGYGLGFAKACDSGFNLLEMFGWLVFSNLFMWIVWIPLAAICGAIFGLLVLSDSVKTYRVLAWLLLAVPIVVFVTTLTITPYGSRVSCAL